MNLHLISMFNGLSYFINIELQTSIVIEYPLLPSNQCLWAYIVISISNSHNFYNLIKMQWNKPVQRNMKYILYCITTQVFITSYINIGDLCTDLCSSKNTLPLIIEIFSIYTWHVQYVNKCYTCMYQNKMWYHVTKKRL